MTTIATLIDAGAVLAEIAEPNKDLLNFASDCREIELTLRFLADGLDTAYERTEDPANRHAKFQRAEALDAAARTLKRAIVDISRTIGELEIHHRLELRS